MIKNNLVSSPRNKHIFRCDQNGPPARREEGAYRERYVTDEQRSRRPIFIATLWAAASWLFFRVARSSRIDSDMIVARALKNSQLTCCERHAYFGDRTLVRRRFQSPANSLLVGRQSSRRMIIVIATILSGVLILMVPVRAADGSSNIEKKLREMLRATMLQLRAAETEKATLQAAQTESAAKEKALTEQVEALTKQSAADKDASDKAIADLKAKVADQEQQLTQLRDALEKWKEGYAKAAEIANAKEAERAKLASQVILLDRKVADRETKNAELFRIGNEILTRYERFGLGDALASREPFVGITRVKLENQVQDYQDKLLNQRIKPGEPPSTPPQPSPSPGQKTKPN